MIEINQKRAVYAAIGAAAPVWIPLYAVYRFLADTGKDATDAAGIEVNVEVIRRSGS